MQHKLCWKDYDNFKLSLTDLVTNIIRMAKSGIMTAGDHGKHEKCVQNFDRKTLRERNNWKTQTQMDNIKIEFVETNRGLVNLGIP